MFVILINYFLVREHPGMLHGERNFEFDLKDSEGFQSSRLLNFIVN